MSYYFKNLKPGQESDESEDDLETILKGRNERQVKSDESDDELKTLSFGSIKKANVILDDEDNVGKKKSKTKRQESVKAQKPEKHYKEESFDEDSGSDIGFFEEDDEHSSKRNDSKRNDSNKRHKHAPTEHSSKKRVSKIRDIPGLDTNRGKRSFYQDIRFDKSMGEATDINVVRERYKFLDEYRQNEISELSSILSDRKFMGKVPEYEKSEMESKLRSMKSRMESIKNRDLERKIVKDYENDLNKNNKNKYHLKESEKRKVVQKWKFEHMKSKQREKVMERKRKKRLGKEFKQFEFHQQR